MDRLLDLADLLGMGQPSDAQEQDDHAASARALLDTLTGAETALRALAKTQRRLLSELDAELAKLEGDIDRLIQKRQRELARHRLLALLYKQELATSMRQQLSEVERALRRTQVARERILTSLASPARPPSYPHLTPRPWRLSARLAEAEAALDQRSPRPQHDERPDPSLST